MIPQAEITSFNLISILIIKILNFHNTLRGKKQADILMHFTDEKSETQ